MRKYIIEEEKYEDGISKFVPIFVEDAVFYNFYDFNKKFPRMSLRFDTFEEAVNIINKDKLRLRTPIETIIHDVD